MTITKSTPPSWAQVETLLGALPRRAVTALAVRAARRIAPVIAHTGEHYGPESLEWMNAIEATLRVVEAYCAGESVSRFTLDLASDVARCAANAMANASQLLGLSAHAEAAELAYAAAAFAADCARAKNPTRAATLAVQAVRAAANGNEITPEQQADLRILHTQTLGDPNSPTDATEDGPMGSLWPNGEPTWSSMGREQFHKAKVAVIVLAPRSPSS